MGLKWAVFLFCVVCCISYTSSVCVGCQQAKENYEAAKKGKIDPSKDSEAGDTTGSGKDSVIDWLSCIRHGSCNFGKGHGEGHGGMEGGAEGNGGASAEGESHSGGSGEGKGEGSGKGEGNSGINWGHHGGSNGKDKETDKGESGGKGGSGLDWGSWNWGHHGGSSGKDKETGKGESGGKGGSGLDWGSWNWGHHGGSSGKDKESGKGESGGKGGSGLDWGSWNWNFGGKEGNKNEDIKEGEGGSKNKEGAGESEGKHEEAGEGSTGEGEKGGGGSEGEGQGDGEGGGEESGGKHKHCENNGFRVDIDVLSTQKGVIGSIYNLVQSILMAVSQILWIVGSRIDLILLTVQEIIGQLTGTISIPQQQILEYVGYGISVAIKLASSVSWYVPILGTTIEPTIKHVSVCVNDATRDMPPAVSHALDSCLMSPVINLNSLIQSVTKGISNTTVAVSTSINGIYKCEDLPCMTTGAMGALTNIIPSVGSTGLSIAGGVIGIAYGFGTAIPCVVANVPIEVISILITIAAQFLGCFLG